MLARSIARSLAGRSSPALFRPAYTPFRTFAKGPSGPRSPRVAYKAQEQATKAPEPIATPPSAADAAPMTAEEALNAAADIERKAYEAARRAVEGETASEPSAQESARPSRSGKGGKGGEHIPKSAYESSTDRKRARNFRYMGIFSLAAIAGFIVYMGRPFDEIEAKIHPEIDASSASVDAFYTRLNARRKDILDFYNEPPSEKLLPDMAPEYARPFTLVLSLEDLMIHSSWDREHGWRIAKRPGLDYFIQYLFQYYEIVVFTNQPDSMAAPIIQKVDPSPGFIMFPLFRAHTRYVDGKYVKDLKYLNRPLEKVIMLEANPDAWSANPDNTVKMAPWKGEKDDRELVALIPFLEYIAALEVDDVRKVITDYDGKHIPTEFARREALLREELEKSLPAKKKGKQPPAWMLSAVGLKPKEQKEEEGVKTFMDMVRERGQQTYRETQKHIMDHKEEMEKEQKEAEKKMAAEMKTSLSKIFTEVSTPRG